MFSIIKKAGPLAAALLLLAACSGGSGGDGSSLPGGSGGGNGPQGSGTLTGGSPSLCRSMATTGSLSYRSQPG